MTTLGKWELDTVVCADALELLAGLPDGSVDLIVTSPPYNMGTQLNGATACGKSDRNWGKSRLLLNGYEGHDDAMPHEEYVMWQHDILLESYRVIGDNGAIFYNTKWRIQGGLLDMRAGIVADMRIRQIIIWDRGAGNNHNPAFFAPEYEVVYLFAKPDFYLAKHRIHYGDVWHIPPERDNDHPAPFPLALAERCILSTNAAIVCDPFMGSGTTALAAQRLGRHFIGGDISAEYVKLANKRLAMPYTLPMLFAEDAP